MNKIKYILVLTGLISLILSSCRDNFLDPYPNGQRDEEDLWRYPNMVNGLIGYIYDAAPKTYDNIEGSYFECITDNAVASSTSGATNINNVYRWSMNAITTGQDNALFCDNWSRDYRYIANCNIFLKDRKGINTHFLVATSAHQDSLIRRRLQGEAYGLRAWWLWDLLQKYGGKATDGRMLGVPIVTDPLDFTTGINLSRNTYDECVQQILRDCDSAYYYLPIAYRDFLVQNADLAYGGSRYWSRIDGMATRAIKADVYLNWASPRYNPGNDPARWDSAAKYAKIVIDFKQNVDGTGNVSNPSKANGFSAGNYINWQNPQDPEIIWCTPYASSSSMEKAFYPGGFGGRADMGATQELVNAFGMKNGYPIDDPRSGYDPNNPYLNRDPRFYSNIFYNNAKALRLSDKSTMYTFETWRSEDGSTTGKDLAGIKSTNSPTNYYIKKFIYMGWNSFDKTVDAQRRCKFSYRWEQMVLNFAEAANHVASPTTPVYGMTAKAAIQMLRTRKTTDNTTGLSSTDPYLDEVSLDQTKFENLVRNERRILTCFEGNRFYDLRRWTTTLDEMNKMAFGNDGYVHGVSVTKKADGTYIYTSSQVQPRQYKSAYLPIPYNEILRMSNLVQNEGWESWK